MVSNQGMVHYLQREERYVLNDVEYNFKPLEILLLIQIIKLMKKNWREV